MNGIIAEIGATWPEASFRHAIDALGHRRPGAFLVSAPKRRIYLFGPAEAPLTDGPLRLWSFGMREEEKPDALKLASEARLERNAPSRWKDAFHILDDADSGKLSIVRGEFNETPVRWTVREGGLFMAPEIKAFTWPARLKHIRSLDPGCSLVFDPARSAASIVDGRAPWSRPVSDSITRAQAIREIERLIHDWLERRLQHAPRPMALAMSGGLDSSIAAWFVTRLGHRPPAYTVWYDAGTDEIPNDVARARTLAALWDLEHREIRVTADDLDDYLEDMIWCSEARSNIVIEGSLHWLILARRMANDGIRTCVSGQGSDHLFASFPEIMDTSRDQDPYALWHANVRTVVTEDREPMITDAYGLNVIGAFKSPNLRDLALSLPIELLWEEIDGALQGKRILREAFSGRLPPAVTDESKINIHLVDNLGRMLQARYGPPRARYERYTRIRRNRLKPPRLRWWRRFSPQSLSRPHRTTT